jgi:hypothetical protein
MLPEPDQTANRFLAVVGFLSKSLIVAMLEPYHLLLAQQVVPQVVLHSLVVVEHCFVLVRFS